MASHSSRAPPPPRGKEKEGEGQPPHPSIDPLGQFMQSIKSGLATFVHSETVQHLLPTVSSHHGSFSGSAPPHTGVVHSVGTTYFSFESGHDELERSVLFSGEHQNGSALYLLGKKYGPFTAGENGAQAERNLRLFQAFKRDFASLYRATYRKKLPAAEQSLLRRFDRDHRHGRGLGLHDPRWADAAGQPDAARDAAQRQRGRDSRESGRRFEDFALLPGQAEREVWAAVLSCAEAGGGLAGANDGRNNNGEAGEPSELGRGG
mmetsp:Transcript_19680/g.49413  ORF Transcript_19680/g.49413 Transcript_19680/m.49413 type:complete len:263 (-) Transcript_19680:1044-1832(-)